MDLILKKKANKKLNFGNNSLSKQIAQHSVKRGRSSATIQHQELKENLENPLDNHESIIVLDSTDGTDVIESSIVETVNKFDFIKTPRSNFKSNMAESRNDVVSLKDLAAVKTPPKKLAKPTTECKVLVRSPGRELLRRSRHNSTVVSSNLSIVVPASVISSSKRESFYPGIDKLTSSSKKTPEVPHLSKSKLKNIERWLLNNDVANVTTPPFANLSVTPVMKDKTRTPVQSIRKPDSDEGNESVDPDVVKVLVAIYGSDWEAQNVLKKSKTEPKKRIAPNEVRTNIFKTARKDKPVGKPNARRNIFSARKQIKGLESPKQLDLDKSGSTDELVITKPLTSVRRKRRRQEDDASPGSWQPPKKNVAKKKIAATPSTATKRRQEDDASPGSWQPAKKNVAKKKTAATPSTAAKRRQEDDASPGSWQPAKKNVAKKKTAATPSTTAKRRKDMTPPNTATRQNKGTASCAKTPRRTFLSSLSVSTPTTTCHPEAQDFKLNFKTKKEELCKRLFKLYNSEVFESRLPEDMSFTWNVKLRGTAGFCYNRKVTKSTGEIFRIARIELGTKVVDRADRLRDTLIHELCHAAAWVLDGKLDAHGAVWSRWAQRAMDRFPELPPVRTCHNYQIMSKYTYRCSECGYCINRHSKSIDLARKRCGYCYGVLELFVNKKRRGKGEAPEFDSTRTMRTPNNFALFVKDNYQILKNSMPGAKHAEVMKGLSEKYAVYKSELVK